MRALTGTDPDRLKEEKERGITIDLGFAHTALAEDLVASFVDVPGHERFVRNMLAGAHGIDAVVLVVAADESVMPQTREHFQICRLLGVPRGLVALTKCDLADAEAQTVAELEIRELVQGSFLEGRPVLRISSTTGQGLEELRRELLALAREARERSSDGLLRLPLDRAFSMKGFGTVVTGTLVAGTLRLGEEIEVLPAARRARVRGLQVHGESVDRAAAGTRTAVNLAGVELDDVGRGQVLVSPDAFQPSSMIDVELSLLPGVRPLADGARLRVHLASAEVQGRVRLLGAGSLAAGAMAVAQLRLESPVVVGRGDRLVLRSNSPVDTIGGAVVLDPLPPRRGAGDRLTLERLSRLTDLGVVAESFLAEAGEAGIAIPRLASRLSIPRTVAREVLQGRPAVALLGPEPQLAVAREALESLGRRAVEAVEAFHRAQPLRPGMPREELRMRVFAHAPAAVFVHVLEDLSQVGRLQLLPDAVVLAGHEVRLSAGERAARTLLLETTQAGGLAGIETAALAAAHRLDVRTLDRVARVLVTEHRLERIGEGLLIAPEHLADLKRRVQQRWPPGSKIEIAAFKEMTGLSRKYVIPLLEYLDRERLTRRNGNDRIVL